MARGPCLARYHREAAVHGNENSVASVQQLNRAMRKKECGMVYVDEGICHGKETKQHAHMV